jgi:hypothetical protein
MIESQPPGEITMATNNEPLNQQEQGKVERKVRQSAGRAHREKLGPEAQMAADERAALTRILASRTGKLRRLLQLEDIVIVRDTDDFSLCCETQIRARFEQHQNAAVAEWLEIRQKEKVVSARKSYDEALERIDPEGAQYIRDKNAISAWRRFKGELFEWAFLTAFLRTKMREVGYADNTLTLGGTGDDVEGIEIDDGRYMWYQRPVKGRFSEREIIPDILITTQQHTQKLNEHVTGIIECKFRSKDSLGAHQLRVLQSQAFDLRPSFAAMASYRRIGPKTRAYAHALGLDVFQNPKLDVKKSEDEEYLFKGIREAYVEMKREKRFQKMESKRLRKIIKRRRPTRPA